MRDYCQFLTRFTVEGWNEEEKFHICFPHFPLDTFKLKAQTFRIQHAHFADQ